MSRSRISVFLLALAFVLPIYAQRQRSTSRVFRAWQAPACTAVAGVPSVRFVSGGVVAANRDHVVNEFAPSIAVSNQANVIYATYGEDLFQSRDAGCTWHVRANLGPVTDSGWYIVLARTGVVYVHDRMNFARVTLAGVERFKMPERMLEVFADPADAQHLRAIGFYGGIYESRDGGESWKSIGDASDYLLYSMTIDPSDFNHLVGSAMIQGIIVSFDGGRTWTPTGQLQFVNVFYSKFSTADPRVVWAVGISIQDGVDRLYRSIDGGQTFAPVLRSVAGLQFSRAELAPHPTNSNVLAFASSNGVALYDHATGNASLVSQYLTRTFAWSPTATLHFSAPDEIIYTN